MKQKNCAAPLHSRFMNFVRGNTISAVSSANCLIGDVGIKKSETGKVIEELKSRWPVEKFITPLYG